MKYLILLHFIYFKDLIYKKICAPQLTSPQNIYYCYYIFQHKKRELEKRKKTFCDHSSLSSVRDLYIFYFIYYFIPYTEALYHFN